MTLRTIIFCVIAFIAGGAALYLTLWFLAGRSRRRRRGKSKTAPEKNYGKKKIGTMDIILIVVGIALTVFTIEMIQIFKETGTEPSTLETCVFAALGGECGVMGWIKTNKERYRDRQWQKEDGQKPPEDFPTNNL